MSIETGASFEVFGDLDSAPIETIALAILDVSGVSLLQDSASFTSTALAQSLVSVFGQSAFELSSQPELGSDFATGGSGLLASSSSQDSSASSADSVSSMLASAQEADAAAAVASASSTDSSSAGGASSDASGHSASPDQSPGSGTPTVVTRPVQAVAASFQSSEQKSLQDAVSKLGIVGPGGNATVPTPQQVQSALVRIQQFVRAELRGSATKSGQR